MKHAFRQLALRAGLALAAATAALAPAHAATGRGEFGIKGIGATDCATLVREYKAGTPNAMMYGGWMYGYITAMNQTSPDTFDLAPWHDLNTLTNFVVDYCARNPRTSFGQAVFNLTSALAPKRLKSASAPIRLRRDGTSFVMYAEVLTRMAGALKAKGLYKGPVAADKPEFTDDLARAVKAFQARNRLRQTGIPDQFTLFRLFEG
jgi:hypothetical protein